MHATRRDMTLGCVTYRVILTKPHHITVSLMLQLLLVFTGAATSTQSRHDDRHSLLADVDINSSDDGLAQRDQPMVSHIMNDIQQQQQQQPVDA